MTARQQAIKDIKDDLKKEGKSFIAYRTELNPVMNELVNNQIKKQSYCMSLWVLDSMICNP